MTVVKELPRYRCHKQVWALQISHLVATPRGWLLGFVDQSYAPHEVADAWVLKHQPEAGGYFVVYEDGYQSYSPADAFEAGYTLVEPVAKVLVCGVDCHQGEPSCNGYCIGEADSPPSAN